MSQQSLKPKIRFLGQKVYSVDRPHTQTDNTQKMKVKIKGILLRFKPLFLPPIIKDRSNLQVIYGEVHDHQHFHHMGGVTLTGHTLTGDASVGVIWILERARKTQRENEREREREREIEGNLLYVLFSYMALNQPNLIFV